jgi:putative cell wall-binding protein
MGAPKRVAVGLLAGALATFGVAFAPNAGAVAAVGNERLAGATRYGTAAAIAGDEAFAAPNHVIIATGENFPDALAASTLSGARGTAPILLTQSAVLTPETSAGLDSLKGKGVTTATIVGGTTAVSEAVQTAITAKGFTVTRVAGTNRYETAAAIATAADAIQDSGSVGGQKTALIATGNNFPDALAGGPAAVRNDLPLLLVENTVPASTKAALTSLGITRVVILGGTAAVSDAVATELQTAVGSAPTRLAGTNRFSTAAAVGDYEIATLAFPATSAVLATGNNFPDALASGPLGGLLGAPIVLTASLPAESQAFLDKHSNTITKLYVSGGTAAIDDATVAAAELAAETVANDGTQSTGTTRPELVSAAFVKTVTTNNATVEQPVGTYVRFVFDEAVTGAAIAPTLFKVYEADGDVFVGTANPAGATATQVDPADNKAVIVRFDTPAGVFDTAAEAATLTTATVDDGAVTGSAGASDTNLEGDAAIVPASGTATAAAAGITAAPDLVSVGNFRAGTTADVTAVDFTFDEAAFAVTTSGYTLVRTDGTIVSCLGPAGGTNNASGGTVTGGNGTTVFTVLCDEPTAGATLTAAQFSRGTVTAGVVSDASTGGNVNPLQAADLSNSGNSDGPDLALITFAPDAAALSDSVAFVFDEAVTAAPTASGFAIYTTTGSELAPLAVTRSTENNAIVIASYADNTLSGASYVGGNVDPAAVTDAQGVAGAADEVGAAPSQTTSGTSGKTDGPDLTSVTISSVTSALGTVTYRAAFTFDEDTGDIATNTGAGVAEDVVLDRLTLVLADGIRLDCAPTTGLDPVSSSNALAARNEDADNTVTCVSFVVESSGAAATQAQVGSAVVGVVDAGAVDDETAGGDTNPEGYELTTGGTGTRLS